MTMHKIGAVYIADTARVLGEVRLGAGTNVWYSSVIRGDVGPIAFGVGCNIQDNCTVHCDEGIPITVGDHVTLGHGAILHGVSVGDGSLLGIACRILDGGKVGKRCLIAAGAVVPPGLEVPDDHVVMGVPGRIIRETTPREREYLAYVAPHYVKLAERHVLHADDATVRPYTG